MNCSPHPTTLTPSQLESEITTLYGHINAATYRLLTLIHQFIEQDAWAVEGVKSCAHWLNWKCGIALGAAREKVRVAQALPNLPAISEAFRRGELSYSKVRAMTRVATPENEGYLLSIARHGTASHVESLVREFRRSQKWEAEHAEAITRHQRRHITHYTDEHGMLVLRAVLPPEQGAVVLDALEAAVDSLAQEVKEAAKLADEREREKKEKEQAEEDCVGEDVPAETSQPWAGLWDRSKVDAAAERYEGLRPEDTRPQRRADGLLRMAETVLSAGIHPSPNAERYQVVVHVDAESLNRRHITTEGQCALESGPWLPAETARRIGCDASLVRLTESPDGTPLDISRKTRSIPPALRRALKARDKGCRFPGCTQHRFFGGHHIHHWANGGETKLGKLVQLCRYHHRLVHEGGFGVCVDTGGGFRFTKPDGEVLEAVPSVWDERSNTVETLVRVNEGEGLDISAETTGTLWDGLPMDHDLAVAALWPATRSKSGSVQRSQKRASSK